MSDAFINGLAGAGGGIIAQLITYPLQTVNTRQQTERDPSKSSARDGAVRQMLEVVKHEGWGRLYGGLAPSLVGTAASQGVYYYFYQIFRNRAETAAQDLWRKGIGDGSVGMFQSLVVAALAGCVNVLLTNPIWVVVTRMQAHKKTIIKSPDHGLQSVSDEAIEFPVIDHQPYRISHVIQELYDEAGMWGFWKGVVPTLIMVSNPSIQFMLYETLVKKIKRRHDSKAKGADELTALEIFILGAVAKLGATVVTYPILVVKARLQIKQRLTNDKRHRYTGTLDAIGKMMRYEGLSGLYKGMGTKIVQSVFAAAVLFLVKEELVKAARVLITGELRPIKSKSKSS
ncbi:peroxisomal nicotinamide adenine dinucleotide carrier-like [Zingiber officinale]|uniref:peroxisomal nicotinamide adenine dinucleotide carrier-like n=1 Tax=Zingiber officinale TaxID=94328 RepID=UPI001C4BB358|nr:peroxisomal nicotinamide adenine dinucleotide carrier-like [Zingiber officinale]